MSKTRIIEAVKNLNLQETQELLSTNPSLLRVTDKQGRNLLHLACSVSCPKLKVPESKAIKMVDSLLDSGLDIESPLPVSDCDVVTVIWFAVCRGRNLPLVKRLIKRGAKPTGLYAAGWWEDMHILDTLVGAGATVDDGAGAETPFFACWCWKKFEAAKFLALKGADVNYQDRKGRTALHHGIEKEFDPALLRWLRKHGASPDIPDNDGISARMKASRKRDKRFLAALD